LQMLREMARQRLCSNTFEQIHGLCEHFLSLGTEWPLTDGTHAVFFQCKSVEVASEHDKLTWLRRKYTHTHVATLLQTMTVIANEDMHKIVGYHDEVVDPRCKPSAENGPEWNRLCTMCLNATIAAFKPMKAPWASLLQVCKKMRVEWLRFVLTLVGGGLSDVERGAYRLQRKCAYRLLKHVLRILNELPNSSCETGALLALFVKVLYQGLGKDPAMDATVVEAMRTMPAHKMCRIIRSIPRPLLRLRIITLVLFQALRQPAPHLPCHEPSSAFSTDILKAYESISAQLSEGFSSSDSDDDSNFLDRRKLENDLPTYSGVVKEKLQEMFQEVFRDIH